MRSGTMMSITCSDCISDLLCCEDSSTVFSSPGLGREDLTEYSSDVDSQPQDIDESIIGLIKDEGNYIPGIDYMERFQSQSLDASTREHSVAWILKVKRFYGLQPLTAYLSVNYFDRFLYSHRLPETKWWPMQLLSVACLSLAAKMEECVVPSLLDLQVEGPNFIFETKTILKMEFLVLSVLDWKLRSITPFDFLSFFAYKIYDSTIENCYVGCLISRATHIILSNMQETRLLEYTPSCIAVASILCAANEFPNSTLLNLNADHAEKWCHGLRKEKIKSCYRLMQASVSISKAPKVLPQLRVTTRTSNSFSEDSSSNSPSPFYKRRKLNNNNLWADDDK